MDTLGAAVAEYPKALQLRENKRIVQSDAS